jgi:hypothetical protein
MAIALRRRRRAEDDATDRDGPRPVDNDGNTAVYDRTRTDGADRPGITTRATGVAAGAAGSGLRLVARVIRAITAGVVAILVAAIVFRVLGANQSNDIVNTVTDWGRWLAGPFEDFFEFDSAKTAIAVNWGMAAAVYLLIGLLIARVFARGAVAGLRARDRRTAF